MALICLWAAPVTSQVMGLDAEMERLQVRAEEAIANGDPDGAAMNIGKAALMASQLARQRQTGEAQWYRGVESLFRAQEQAYRALALFQRAGGQPPASSGVCGSMNLAKQYLDASLGFLVDASPHDRRLQPNAAEWLNILEGMNADFQCP